MKSRPPIKVSSGATGINRFASEARSEDLADALNLVNVDGTARSRDAYSSVSAGPVFLRAARRTRVAVGSDSARVERPHRTVTTPITAGSWIFVGSDSPFDGVDLSSLVSTNLFLPSTQKTLQVQYWNGSGFVDFEFYLNTCQGYVVGATCSEPLARPGRIHWHRPTTWPSILLFNIGTNVANFYWIRMRVVQKNTARTPVVSEVTAQVYAPGILAFDRYACSGMFQTSSNGVPQLIVAGGHPKSALFGGDALSVWGFSGSEKELSIVSRKSTGILGEFDTATPGGPSLTPGTTAVGTIDRITDEGRGLAREAPVASDGLYLRTRPYGRILFDNVALTGGTTEFLGINDARLQALRRFDLDHCIFEVTDPGGTALTVGEHRQIYNFDPTTDQLNVYDALSAAPDATVVGQILAPPDEVYIHQSRAAYPLDGLDASPILLVPNDTRPYGRQISDNLDPQRIHFEVRSEGRFVMSHRGRWSAAFNPITKETILVNGGRPYSYCHGRLKLLEAGGRDDPLIQQFIGEIRSAGGFGATQVDAGSKFRLTPPSGHIVLDFGGRMVIIGRSSVSWSAPHQYNHIWPLVYEALINDQFGGSITAAAVLYDKLIVSTTRSIFEGQLVDSYGIAFRPVATGVGFVTHAALCEATIQTQKVLIGPAADGLIMYTAGEPTYLIDDWSRVIEGGISEYALASSCACVWKQRNLYLLAVGSKTSGAIGNNLVLVYDYVRRQAWLWSAPWGVSSLTTVKGSGGKEAVLIGTDDGMVQRLVSSSSDDGLPITKRFRTHPVIPFGERPADFKRISVTLKAMGRGESLDMTLRLEDNSRPWAESSIPVDTGQLSYDSPLTPWEDSVWPLAGDVTIPVNCPLGTTGRQLSIQIETQGNLDIASISLEAEPKGGSRR